MLKINNLIVIGTSHIASQSVNEVREVIERIRPSIVALELDQGRLSALMSGKRRKMKWSDIMRVGWKGFLFNSIGAWIEKKLGESVSTKPGSEMKAAVKSAEQVNASIALIDQDIQITLKKISSRMTIKEKMRFMGEIMFGLLGRKEEIIDLTKVPEKKVIERLTAKMRKNYPSLYKTLVEERNEVMAKNLYKIMELEKERLIVAVVGAGHEKELIGLLKGMEKR